MGNLNSRTALITGGGQGIGKGISLELAAAGADIIIAQRNYENAKKVVTEIRKMGREAIALYLDVTDEKSVKRSVQKAIKYFPQIDILVNNAGVTQENIGAKTTTQDFDLCYEVNLKGVWTLCQELAPHFKKKNYGKIVNISSVAGRKGHAGGPSYCASKAAVISLTQSLAEELGPYNINVNTVCPGIIWTPMWEKIERSTNHTNDKKVADEQIVFKSLIEGTPLGRAQTAEDIGYAVVFLASPLAENITGQAINVDGGLTMN